MNVFVVGDRPCIVGGDVNASFIMLTSSVVSTMEARVDVIRLLDEKCRPLCGEHDNCCFKEEFDDERINFMAGGASTLLEQGTTLGGCK